MEQKLLIGVSGESGSGKTHFCAQFISSLSEQRAILIHADHYFKQELPKMVSPVTQKEYDDWNSPASLDYDKLRSDVEKALEQAADIVVVEGAYIFCYEELRNRMQLKIFIETDIELRLYRRIKRNMEAFHMEMDEIAAYYLEAAKFQEKKYSAPTKIYADMILNGAKDFALPIQILRAYVNGRSNFA